MIDNSANNDSDSNNDNNVDRTYRSNDIENDDSELAIGEVGEHNSNRNNDTTTNFDDSEEEENKDGNGQDGDNNDNDKDVMDATVVPFHDVSETEILDPEQDDCVASAGKKALEAYLVPSRGKDGSNDHQLQQQQQQVIEAKPYVDPTNRFKIYTRIAWTVVGILLIAIVVSVSVILTTRKKKNSSVPAGNNAPSLSPTTEPILPNVTLILQPVMTIAFDHDVESAIAAYDWMVEQDASWILYDPATPDWKVVQRYVAVFLFFSTGGQRGEWKHLIFTEDSPNLATTFLNSKSECEWNGVIPYYFTDEDGTPVDERGNVTVGGILCNNNGIVNGIRMPQLSLTGKVPYQMFGMFLPNLETLDFNFGSIDLSLQPLPTELGLLTNLKVVSLGGSKLEGTIPTELGLLTNLRSFTLTGNALTGTLPVELSNLTNMKRLSLAGTYGNELTGTIPSSFGRWSMLRVCSVAGNKLSGSLPPELGSWTNIETLDVSSNSLTGSLSSAFGRWSKMEGFGASQNSFSGTLPSQLSNWSSIKAFQIWENFLTGSIPSSYGQWTSIEWFGISSNILTGTLPSELGNWVNVKNAYFHQNLFTGVVPSSFSAWAMADLITVPAQLLENDILPQSMGSLPLVGL